MSTKLHSYANYRPTDLAGIPLIPAHWQCVRIKHLAELRSGQSITSEAIDAAGDYPVYGGNGLRGYTSSFTHNGKFVLIGRQGALCGNVNYAEGQFWASEHAVVASPVQAFDRFWFGELLRYLNLNQYSTSAAQPGLAVERIRNIEVPFPPYAEQDSISRFLKHITRTVAALIRNKRRLIALLNEEKQAIIQQAVTRGLDPDVAMKPSGLKWWGEIPAHWEATKLYRITDARRPIMYGIVLPGPNVDDGVFIVKGGNCEPGRLRPEYLSRTTHDIESGYVRSRLKTNDIVYAIRGSIGAAELVPRELEGANLTQDAARTAPSDRVDAKWLLFAVKSRSFFAKLDAGAVGATIRGINIRDLKRADIVLPPLHEQQEIARFLEHELYGLDKILMRIRQEIDLMHEYRTRLIADVVTGQLDVREAAASFPNIEEDGTQPLLDDAPELTDPAELRDEDIGFLGESADAAD